MGIDYENIEDVEAQEEVAKRPGNRSNLELARKIGKFGGEVRFTVDAIAEAIKARHTGELTSLIRSMNKTREAPKTFEDAFKFGQTLLGREVDPKTGKTIPKGFDKAAKRANMIQGLVQPFGELGIKAAAKIAEKTGEGVCFDAAACLEQDLKKLQPTIQTEIVGGVWGDTGHAVVLSGDAKQGFKVLDSLNQYQVDIRDPKTGLLVRSKKEANEILKKGINLGGILFKRD